MHKTEILGYAFASSMAFVNIDAHEMYGYNVIVLLLQDVLCKFELLTHATANWLSASVVLSADFVLYWSCRECGPHT